MLFPRARKNQHAHGLVIPRIEQRMLQLFHRLRFSAFSTFGRLKVMYAIPSLFSYKISS